MSRNGLLGILAWFLAAGRPYVPAEGPWWATDLKPGGWQVGFTSEALHDSARNLAPHRPRVVQLSIWYPASNTGRTHLRFGEYLRLAAAETTSVDTAALGDRYARVLDLTRRFLDATLRDDRTAFPPATRDSAGLRPVRLGR